MADTVSDIATFYDGRSVFITGASGFVGKVLVEKLLRSCPGITCIYILLRPKRGKDIKARTEILLNSRIFDILRRDQPSFLQKIIPVEGDITLPNLGISNEDVNTIRSNVSVVFHSAATVKFDEPLTQAVLMNIIGTRSVIELCRQITNLAALIHVSTAYCNCNQTEVDEVIYPPPADPEKFIQWIMSLDEDTIKRITPSLLGKRPNTYTYTKAIAEHLFQEKAAGLPAAIVRPSIVAATWKDPFAGWLDNLNGPTGLITGIGKGAIKTVLCNSDYVADFIPVDVLINILIAVSWNTANQRSSKNIKIFNCTSSTVHPLKWGTFVVALKSHIIQKPFREVLWYPGGALRTNRLMHSFYVNFTHLLPARIMDLISVLIGRKPMFLKLQEKVWKSCEALEYFTMNEWKFHSNNTTHLYQLLTTKDKELFDFDLSGISWCDYIRNYFDGIKKFILNENEKDPSNFKRMYYVHRLGQLVSLAVVFKIVMSLSTPLKNACIAVLRTTLHLAQLLPS